MKLFGKEGKPAKLSLKESNRRGMCRSKRAVDGERAAQRGHILMELRSKSGSLINSGVDWSAILGAVRKSHHRQSKLCTPFDLWLSPHFYREEPKKLGSAACRGVLENTD